MNELNLVELQQVNLANLKWLETYAAKRPDLRVSGVEIMRCFTYDLIQTFNNMYLKGQIDATSNS